MNTQAKRRETGKRRGIENQCATVRFSPSSRCLSVGVDGLWFVRTTKPDFATGHTRGSTDALFGGFTK